ncbi:MAG: type I phosphomannose isomerase catalytic subunit [Oscillospiraceae bacterium]
MKAPLFLGSVYKNYIWGGENLKKDFNKHTDVTPLAESWELCAHRDGTNIILSGDFAGRTLGEYLRADPAAISGESDGTGELPLLIKYIDAREPLSVQVHPDDAYARRIEGENGKTEMWYVLDCEKGASLVYGFNRTVTKHEFEVSIKNGTLETLLRRVPVKRGDVFFIKSTTLHAIGAGILIAEIQQCSNSTYRVYDYGRVDADGRGRELHIRKALDITRLEPSDGGINPRAGMITRRDGCVETSLVRCDYFDVRRLDICGKSEVALAEHSFTHLMAVEGEGELEMEGNRYSLVKGDSIFIPAQSGVCWFRGRCALIASTL